MRALWILKPCQVMCLMFIMILKAGLVILFRDVYCYICRSPLNPQWQSKNIKCSEQKRIKSIACSYSKAARHPTNQFRWPRMNSQDSIPAGPAFMHSACALPMTEQASHTEKNNRKMQPRLPMADSIEKTERGRPYKQTYGSWTAQEVKLEVTSVWFRGSGFGGRLESRGWIFWLDTFKV